jgi:DNA mismatch repair protein MutS
MFRFRKQFIFKRLTSSLSIQLNEKIVESLDQKTQTPLKKLVLELQNKHPDHILLIQNGMFYEIYDSGGYLDHVSNILGLKVAIKKNIRNGFPKFAGFPCVSLKSNLEALLKNNKTVAVVDQFLCPLPAENIDRKITRIYTPGTIIEDADLNENSFLLAISCNQDQVGISWLDVNTGQVQLI